MDHTRSHKILQANLNYFTGAKVLLLQTMAEWSVKVVVAAEPSHPNWVGDNVGSVAIISSTAPDFPQLSLKEKGLGYVVASWGEITFIGVYFSSNRSLAAFEAFLDRLKPAVH